MKPIEAMTLVPLGALVVIFGLFPGLCSTSSHGSVSATPGRRGRGRTGRPRAVARDGGRR